MRKSRSFFVGSLVVGVTVAFGAEVPQRAQPVDVKGVPYVVGGGPDQVMDISWPSGQPRATVLFIHGGSLQETGERRSSPPYAGVCKPFVAADIACASMDYRLAPRHTWPAMPNDVASAVAKLRQILNDRGVDSRRLFLFGHSSGCHLAAVVGANPAYLERVGMKPTDLAGVIAMGCTLDREDAALRKLTVDEVRAGLAHDAEETATFGNAENWLSANPASFIGPQMPPLLVIVAREERFMPPILEQGARVTRRLLEQNVPADVVIVPGRHMASISSIGKPADPTFEAIMRFISNPSGLPFDDSRSGRK